jgi:hypothetical protein
MRDPLATARRVLADPVATDTARALAKMTLCPGCAAGAPLAGNGLDHAALRPFACLALDPGGEPPRLGNYSRR